MDRVARHRAAVWTGAAALAGHGVAALAAAADVFGMPIEQGGLFFGPLLGIPGLFAAMFLLSGAALLPTPHWRPVPVGGLVLVTAGDLYVVASGFGTPAFVAGGLLAATALAFLASVTEWYVRPARPARRDPNAPSEAVMVACFVLVGFLAVVITLAGA